MWTAWLGMDMGNSLDAVGYTDNGRTDLTWGKARKSTGLLHDTRYSMPGVQGRCLSSAGQ